MESRRERGGERRREKSKRKSEGARDRNAGEGGEGKEERRRERRPRGRETEEEKAQRREERRRRREEHRWERARGTHHEDATSTHSSPGRRTEHATAMTSAGADSITRRSRRPDTAEPASHRSMSHSEVAVGAEDHAPWAAWMTGAGDGAWSAQGREWGASRVGRAMTTARRYFVNDMLGASLVANLMAHDPDLHAARHAAPRATSAAGAHPFGKAYPSLQQIRRQELVSLCLAPHSAKAFMEG